jgi:hypothetical protein
MKRAKTRINQFAVSRWNLQADQPQNGHKTGARREGFLGAAECLRLNPESYLLGATGFPSSTVTIWSTAGMAICCFNPLGQ